MNIRRFRTIQTIISIILFIAVFLFCWNTTGFNLQNIQLSYFGVDNRFSWLWNACLIVLSISIYINVFLFIKYHARKLIYKNFLHAMFFLVSSCLFLTGAVDMHHPIHNTVAYVYFFAYPLAVFLLAHFNRKHLQYKEWKTHLIFSVAMVVVPLIFLKWFYGMAIAEIIHSSIVMLWNLWILLLV